MLKVVVGRLKGERCLVFFAGNYSYTSK